MKRAVSVAVCLSMKTIKVIGNVVTAECADIILRSSDLNSDAFNSEDFVIAHEDCRLFKRSVYSGAFHGTRNFMCAPVDGRAEERVNIVHHIRH